MKILILTFIINLISGIITMTLSSSQANPTCPQFKNCLFYQVTQNYTDYGCGVCQKEYALSADASGSGECLERHNIRNCAAALSKPDILDGTPICFECQKDHVLRNNSMLCSPVPRRQRVRNCKNYYQNNTRVFCNVCEDGFTLDESRRKCISGCDLRNCKNCQMINGRTYCFNCKDGFIGVSDEKMMIYRECLSCEELRQNQRVRGPRGNDSQPATPPSPTTPPSPPSSPSLPSPPSTPSPPIPPSNATSASSSGSAEGTSGSSTATASTRGSNPAAMFS